MEPIGLAGHCNSLLWLSSSPHFESFIKAYLQLKGLFMAVGCSTRQKHLSIVFAQYLRTTAEEAWSLNIPVREERTRLEGMGGLTSSDSVRTRTMIKCCKGSLKELYVHTYRVVVAWVWWEALWLSVRIVSLADLRLGRPRHRPVLQGRVSGCERREVMGMKGAGRQDVWGISADFTTVRELKKIVCVFILVQVTESDLGLGVVPVLVLLSLHHDPENSLGCVHSRGYIHFVSIYSNRG